jgi:hypothetical protein
MALESGIDELGLHADGRTGEDQDNHRGKDYCPEIFPRQDRLV